MSKFIIKIKLANGTTKQVKVYVDNRTAELLNQCDARVRQIYLDFKLFYEANKADSTIYLFRYQQSEYLAMEAASWKTDKGSFWEGDGLIPTYKPDRIDTNNYFFQETVCGGLQVDYR